jgi:hypothetical protein
MKFQRVGFNSLFVPLLVLGLLTAFALAFQGGNPQIPQGGGATFPGTGTEAPANGEQWDIVNSSAVVVAKTSIPNGWTVSVTGSNFTVTAPTTAAVATNYKVRYGDGGQVGNARVSAGATRRVPKLPAGDWGPSVAGKQQQAGGANPPVPPPVPSGLSATFDVIAPPPPPDAPSGLVAIAVSGNRINLTWVDNASSETGFKIERRLTVGGSWAQIALAPANATGYANLGLVPNTSYTYRVRATNAFTNSAYSNEATDTTLNGTTPPPSLQGTDFWLALPASGPDFGMFGPNRAVALISSATGASGTITVPSTNATTPFSVNAGESVSVDLDTSLKILTGDGTNNGGIHITSDNPISAQVVDYQAAATEGYSAIPTPLLGTDHIAVGYKTTNSAEFSSRLAVLATQNDTEVTITPKTACGSSRPAGISYTISLDAGQVYQVKAETVGADLTGTMVRSDKPVAVYSGNKGAFVTEYVYYANPLTEQILPTDRWGSEFFVVPFATRTSGSLVKVVASRTNTVVSIEGEGIVATLNRGEVYEQIAYSPLHITSTKSIQVAQFSLGAAADGTLNADPAMVMVPAVNQFVDTAVVRVDGSFGMAGTYVSVVVPNAAVGDFVQDGTVVPAGSFTTIGSSGYARASLSLTAGSHVFTTMTTGAKFGIYQYAFGYCDAYAFTSSQDLPSNGGIPPAPATPTNLTATPILGPGAQLAWTDNSSNETGFKIERKLVYQGIPEVWQDVAEVPANTTSYTDPALAPLCLYVFRVKALNELESDYSNEASVTTFDKLPDAPNSLGIWVRSESRIDIGWNDNAYNETGYKIERKKGANGTWQQIHVTGQNAYFYYDTGLETKTLYYYRVRATNTVGDSAYSEERSATTFDVPPAPPNTLAATPISWSQISLSWVDGSNNEQGFKIERRQGVGNWSQIAMVGENATTWQDSGLFGGTEYTYRVRSYNDGGDSAYTNEASATTLTPPLPDAPSDLTATALSSSKIHLTWTDNANSENGFRIERKTGSGAFLEVATVGPNVTTFTNAGLQALTTYTFRVRAYNAAGTSAYTNQASATTLDPSTDPHPPGYIAAYATSNSSIRVFWDQVDNATQYRIYRRTTNGAYPQSPTRTVNVVTGTEHYVDDTGLTANVDYYYVVTAVVNGTESERSEEDSHFPSDDAIPWNSTPTAIVSKVKSLGTGIEIPYGVPPGNTDVMGPNNVSYSDASQSPYMTEGVLDLVNWKQVFNGYEAPMGAFEWKVPIAGGQQPPPQTQQVGSFRRVTTDEGDYTGVTGWAYLPKYGGSDLSIRKDATIKESACVYVGCSGTGGGRIIEVDAGVAFEKAAGSMPNRWQPFIRIQDGNANVYNYPVKIQLSARALVRETGRAYVSADSVIGNSVFLGFQINRRNRLCTFYVFAVDAQGLYLARSLNAAVKVESHSGLQVTKLRMKRIISLPQTVPISYTTQNGQLTAFTNPLDNSVEWKTSPKAYYPSGSFFNNSSFQVARLFTNGNGIMWPQSINGGRLATTGFNGDNYKSQPTVTTTGQQETGGENGGTGERCHIDH